jgi:hypothetical protein
MKPILPIIAAAMLAGAGGALAQAPQPSDPAKAGDAASTAQPASQVPQPVQNPESTVGLAPSDQPINNAKARVAGQVVPSSQDTAAHNASILEHDRQPILTHTFNFTAEQKQAIVDALANEKASDSDNGAALKETMVVPSSLALKPVPDQIGQEMPWVKPYYYVKTGDRIALVNPLGRYVAAIIE